MCRGASALVDGFRWVLGLQRADAEGDNKRIFVKLLKTNYCKLGDTLYFTQDFTAGGILKLKGIVSENSEAAPSKTKIEGPVYAPNDLELIKSSNSYLLQNETENDW